MISGGTADLNTLWYAFDDVSRVFLLSVCLCSSSFVGFCELCICFTIRAGVSTCHRCNGHVRAFCALLLMCSCRAERLKHRRQQRRSWRVSKRSQHHGVLILLCCSERATAKLFQQNIRQIIWRTDANRSRQHATNRAISLPFLQDSTYGPGQREGASMVCDSADNLCM